MFDFLAVLISVSKTRVLKKEPTAFFSSCHLCVFKDSAKEKYGAFYAQNLQAWQL